MVTIEQYIILIYDFFNKGLIINLNIFKMKKTLFSILLFSVTTLFSQTNVLINGGLENWTGGSLDTWVTENDVTQNTMDFEEGTSSGLFSIVDSSLNPKIISQVPMEAGIEYTITYKFKYLDSNFGGAHPITLKIIRSGSGSTITSNRFAQNNDWTEVENTFTPDVTGDYDLSISLGTFDTESFSVLIDDVQVFDPATLSISDFAIALKSKIKIFPTITSDIISISTDTDINIKELLVYDLKGIKLDYKQTNYDELNISNLTSGIYIIAVSTNQGDMAVRIVKE